MSILVPIYPNSSYHRQPAGLVLFRIVKLSQLWYRMGVGRRRAVCVAAGGGSGISVHLIVSDHPQFMPIMGLRSMLVAAPCILRGRCMAPPCPKVCEGLVQTAGPQEQMMPV